MYVHYLLGLGGWVGASPDEDEEAAPPTAAGPPAASAQPALEPRTGCRSGRPAHRCCRRRAPGLRS
ncbi:MAG TPA: hypothetical protein VFQ76_10290 [Longimicrobiaceae bacterium]|nr:hypothetical protein [Longimicrobiaceae bacterium]